MEGWILHVDRFGNCVSSIHESELPGDPGGAALTVEAGPAAIRGLSRTYGDVESGATLALIGSAGFLEISVREGSAAVGLGLSPGDPVAVLG